jgi:hypothetical protein
MLHRAPTYAFVVFELLLKVTLVFKVNTESPAASHHQNYSSPDAGSCNIHSSFTIMHIGVCYCWVSLVLTRFSIAYFCLRSVEY